VKINVHDGDPREIFVLLQLSGGHCGIIKKAKATGLRSIGMVAWWAHKCVGVSGSVD
jgi:hypothetical protein